MLTELLVCWVLARKLTLFFFFFATRTVSVYMEKCYVSTNYFLFQRRVSGENLYYLSLILVNKVTSVFEQSYQF